MGREEQEAVRDQFEAVLDCAPYRREEVNQLDQGSHRPAIRLLGLGGDQYARLYSNVLFDVPSAGDEAVSGADGFRYIYVRQQPVFVFPDIVVQDDTGQSDSGPTGWYRHLREAFPNWQWNMRTRTLKAGKSKVRGALGVFRFEAGYSLNPFRVPRVVDVFVGVSPGNQGPGSWDCWCYQSTPEIKDDGTRFSLLEAITSSNEVVAEEKNLANRHAYQTTVAIVEKVRLHNRTYISLVLSQLYEIDTTTSITTAPNIPYMITSTNVAHLVVIRNAALYVVEDSMEHSIASSGEARSEWTKVRINSRQNSTSSCIDSLQKKLAMAKEMQFAILRPDDSPADAFEGHFSALLIKACMNNNVSAARELIDSELSTALVEGTVLVTSEQRKVLGSLFDGFRAIHWAVVFRHDEVARLLLDRGVDKRSVTKAGLTTLHLAAITGNANLLSILLGEGDEKEDSQWPDVLQLHHEHPAHFAAAYGTPEAMHEILRRSGKAPHIEIRNKYNESPLHRAAAMNNTPVAIAMISRAAIGELDVPDCSYRSPLWHAVAAGAHSIAQALLKAGARPDLGADTWGFPIHVAARYGHYEMVKLLVDHSANLTPFLSPNNAYFTPCHFAALSGDAASLKYLIDQGASPHKRAFGMSVMHVAAANGRLDCVQVLYRAGCSTKHKSVYCVLLDETAEVGVRLVEYPFEQRKTALEMAIQCGHQSVVKFMKKKRR